MKKFLSILLALALVLSLGTVAFAAEYDSYIDVPPKISKTYQVNNGTAPAETFTYTFNGVSYEDTNGDVVEAAEIPAIADATISFDAITAETGEETKEATLAIDVADYQLGVYTYEVTEQAGNTAGVTYTTDKLYLILSVILNDEDKKCFVAAMRKGTENGDKVNTLTNEYDSGSLTVTKKIEGNMADMDKKFDFTITFDAGDKDFSSTIQSNGNGMWNSDDLTYTIALGHNESVTLSNIPAGVTYTVEEVNGDYTREDTPSDETKTISADDQDTVTVTNTLNYNGVIDTGVFMDSLPYVLLLVGACAGLVVFFARRRMTHKG